MSGHKLVRLDAPAYWTRWAVEVDGTTIGYVERRGGFAPWTVRDADWRRIGGQSKRADAIELLKSHTTIEGNPMTDTTIEAEAGLRAWSKGSYDAEAVVDIILGTHLAEYVVPRYLDWDEDHTMARPKLGELLDDVSSGKQYMSSSARLLATLAYNLWRGPGGEATELDLRGLWHLDPTNRRVVVATLAKALGVTL